MNIPKIYRDPRAIGAGDCPSCKGTGIESDPARCPPPDPSKSATPCHACEGTGHAPLTSPT